MRAVVSALTDLFRHGRVFPLIRCRDVVLLGQDFAGEVVTPEAQIHMRLDGPPELCPYHRDDIPPDDHEPVGVRERQRLEDRFESVGVYPGAINDVR